MKDMNRNLITTARHVKKAEWCVAHVALVVTVTSHCVGKIFIYLILLWRRVVVIHVVSQRLPPIQNVLSVGHVVAGVPCVTRTGFLNRLLVTLVDIEKKYSADGVLHMIFLSGFLHVPIKTLPALLIMQEHMTMYFF